MKKIIKNICNLSLAIFGIIAMVVDLANSIRQTKKKWLKATIVLVDGLALVVTVVKLIDPIIDSVKEMAEGFDEAYQSMSSAASHFIGKLTKTATDKGNADSDGDWRPRIYNNAEEFRAAHPDAEISDEGIKFPRSPGLAAGCFETPVELRSCDSPQVSLFLSLGHYYKKQNSNRYFLWG